MGLVPCPLFWGIGRVTLFRVLLTLDPPRVALEKENGGLAG